MASSTLSPSHHLLTQHYPKQEGKNEDKGAFSSRGSVFTQRGISCLEAPQRSPNSSRSALLHNMQRRMGSLWLNEANKDPIPWNLTAHCHLNKTKDFEGTGAKKKKTETLARRGFPWCLRGEGICLQCRRPRFDPWIETIPWRRDLPTPVFLPGESHGQRSLVGYSPQEHKESDTTEQLTFHFVKEEPGRTVRWEKKYLPQKSSAQTTWGLKVSVLGENVTFCKDKGGTEIV